MRSALSLAGLVSATVLLGSACNITPPPPASPPPSTPTSTAPPVGAPTPPAALPGSELAFSGTGSPTSGDWQTFPFHLDAASTVRTSLDWNATSAADLNVFLLRSGSSFQDANGTTARPETMSSSLTAGDYQVAVKVKSGGTAAFTVSLDVTSTAPPPAPTPTTPTPTTPTPPPPAPTPPPSTSWSPSYPGDAAPGRLRWGTSITGNGDPVSRHENAAGAALGLRRTFFSWDQRTGGMVTTARADVAAGRVPWVSIKPPSSAGSDWQAVASGQFDAQLDEMLRALGTVPGPVWFTMHHEPEGGGGGGNTPDDEGGPTAWRAMQAKVRERIRATGVRNVAFGSILMAYSFDRSSGRNPADWWVADTFDFAGIDYYVDSEAPSDLATAKASFLAARSFYGARGVDMAVGEWANKGTDAQAAAEMQGFYQHALGSATDGKGAQVVGMSYFDSTLNGGWPLDGAPLDMFRTLMRASTSLHAGQG